MVDNQNDALILTSQCKYCATTSETLTNGNIFKRAMCQVNHWTYRTECGGLVANSNIFTCSCLERGSGCFG